MKLTEKLIFICFLINAFQSALFITLFIGIIPLAIISPDSAKNIILLFQDKTINLIYTILTMCSFVHWIYCLRFWYKYDRYSKAIFPLVFPHILYAPFYFYQVKIKKRPLKGKLIEKEPEDSNEVLSITDTEFVELTRKNIFGVIDLWTSKKNQLDYQKNVPNAQVSAELFCQWEDFYFPDSDDFSQSFNIKELKILSEFDNVMNNIINNTHHNLPTIKEFIETEEWKVMNKKAIKIKKELNTVGNKS